MSRVTPAELKVIYPTSATDETLQVFIDMANSVVDEELLNKGLSEDRLKMIELYLSAHFASMSLSAGGTVGGLKKRKVGDSEEEYVTNAQNYGYMSSKYGQTAVLLDTSGTLGAQTNNPVKARFNLVGNGRNGLCS